MPPRQARQRQPAAAGGVGGDDRCHRVEIDLTDPAAALDELVAGADAVVHLASVVSADAEADPAGDATKAVPASTYAMTKVVLELLVNEATHRGQVDGRIARLPTVIARTWPPEPGRPNLAARTWPPRPSPAESSGSR